MATGTTRSIARTDCDRKTGRDHCAKLRINPHCGRRCDLGIRQRWNDQTQHESDAPGELICDRLEAAADNTADACNPTIEQQQGRRQI
jgi:hypothetical protein